MKFIFEKNAPDIPLEVLEAQENDNLILFCGAGISYPDGLPLFKGLVDGVYQDLTAEPSQQEQQAIKQWRYDTALELLEKRYYSENRKENHLVRNAIVSRLTFKTDAKFETHKAILELAKTKEQKYRLVTTNVDHGFKLADPASIEVSDAAPKLPVPKPHKWQSIVYLHGIIDKKLDPNSENLIFTSGDFGAAYLTERWASRFVSELFRHFTVLFVGYSIDDPVMRYMTDAIAADRRKGGKDFKEPYVLAGIKKSQFETAKLDWEAKGVTPLLYEQRNKHSKLHKTLKIWANYCRDGLNGVERIIKTHAVKIPVQPYEYDDSVKRVIDNLNKTNYAAKIFRSLNTPPAPIEWLPILDKESLLAKSKVKQKNLNPLNYSIQPHSTTVELWSWLVEHHLESKLLVEWIIDKINSLHPDFINLIKWGMHTQSLKKEYLIFWRFTLLNHSNCVFSDGFNELQDLKKSRNTINLLRLSKLFEPKIQFLKAYASDVSETDNPYRAEVIIGIEKYEFEQVTQYANEMTSMLCPMTNALKQAMDFWGLLGQADDKNDLSNLYLASIQPHSQNKGYHNWCFLIELCRDLWEAAYHVNIPLALAILELWKEIPYPVFKRLVFHAYSVSEVATTSEQLDYLLSENAYWFWSVTTAREKFRLLSVLCPKLGHDELSKLEQAILKGAPRNIYPDDLSEKKFKERNNHQIWLHLAKLESFGVSLSEKTKIVYRKLSSQYPERKLQKDDRDEFSFWMGSVRWGSTSDITSDELILLSVEERVKKILELSAEFSEGRIDQFRSLCKEKPGVALETLSFLVKHSQWDCSIWHAGFGGLSDADDQLWPEVAQLIIQFPDQLIQREAWVISWWVKNAIKLIKANSVEEAYFWQIFNLLITHTESIEIRRDDVISQAINHPIGILTEALINRISIREIKSKGKIVDKEVLAVLDRLLNCESNELLLAQVVLLSRLDYFYAIDPEWTQAKLIPLLDWQVSNDAAIFWQGYLSNPRISTELALDIKDVLFTALCKHTQDFGESATQVFQLFAIICLEFEGFYKDKEQREVLKDIGGDGLKEVVQFIYHGMGDDKAKNDLYWKNRVKPFFTKAWPIDATSLKPKIAEYFSLICFALDDEFEDAVKSIKSILIPFKCDRFFLTKLTDSQHITKHPIIAFDIFCQVRVKKWDIDIFKEIFMSFAENAPSLKENIKYQEINKFLISNVGHL